MLLNAGNFTRFGCNCFSIIQRPWAACKWTPSKKSWSCCQTKEPVINHTLLCKIFKSNLASAEPIMMLSESHRRITSIVWNNVRIDKNLQESPSVFTFQCSPMMHSGREIIITLVCDFQTCVCGKHYRFGEHAIPLNQHYNVLSSNDIMNVK